jgi:hypothetical protein
VKNNATACLILFSVWSIFSDHVLAAEAIILRTAVTPEEVWVGQKVLLHVDVLAKNGWAQLKKVGDAEVDGAYLLRLETQGTRLSETIEGDSYTGQRYEFMLFAQRDGTLTVPPMPVDVEIKTWGAGGGTRTERMWLPLVEFVTRTPPGAEGLSGLISTTDLTANQNWDPATESPMVGDALKRTISLRAKDVSGMAFAPMLHGKIENLGIYPGEPAVEDKFARGDLTGTRVETVAYVFERAGDFEIPDVTLPWWDVDASELKHVVLPGLSLQVTGSPVTESEALQQAEHQQNTRLLWSALLAILVAAVAVVRFGDRLANRWTAWRRARSEKEAMYFRRVRRSARSGDQNAVLRDTMRWLDRINDKSHPARLDRFIQQYGDVRSQEAAIHLTNGRVSDRNQSDIAALINGLAAARKRWQKEQRGKGRVTGLLPDLNGGI